MVVYRQILTHTTLTTIGEGRVKELSDLQTIVPLYIMWSVLYVIISVNCKFENYINMAYINNVLYYIDQNIKGSSENKVIEVCKLLFQEKEIIEAKQYLLETCQPVLARINKSLSEDVKKERRNSDDRSRVDVNIKDIIKILECFMGNDQKLEIMAKNPESVPKVKPESVSMVSIVTKLQEVDVT